jgi:hypothetical protein
MKLAHNIQWFIMYYKYMHQLLKTVRIKLTFNIIIIV